MHEHYGFKNKVADFDRHKLIELLRFRIDFIEEELNELKRGYISGESTDVVDALIDLCVVAIGSLDLFGVDAHEAWDRVHDANMKKEPGVKHTRPNTLGLPDLIKPLGWRSPEHDDNTGRLDETFK